jgi:hypothetical protein
VRISPVGERETDTVGLDAVGNGVEGAEDGVPEGEVVGGRVAPIIVGTLDGTEDGDPVGLAVGGEVGGAEALTVGARVGALVGLSEGVPVVGCEDGAALGSVDGVFDCKSCDRQTSESLAPIIQFPVQSPSLTTPKQFPSSAS